MHVFPAMCSAMLFAALPLSAQVAPTPTSTPAVKDSITVLGTAEPVTEGESARVVEVLDVSSHPALVQEPAAYLRVDPSVDIQMRGAMGVQSDVSIRGGSFEQTLVLLNGLRINDAETSHFNLDVPVPLPAIQSIDVLHGAGSTLYGSDAVAGVVNLQTLKPTSDTLRLRMGAGSYGINQQGVTAAIARHRVSEVLSGARDFSTGFIADRDYRSESVSSETRTQSSPGETDILLAMSDRAFGAAQFYGNYSSYERTKGWFAALQQQLGTKTAASLAYRRHTDIFVLRRATPFAYQNNHIDSSWQGILRRKDTAGSHAKIFSGLDFNTDQINSNNLGKHGRNRGAGYLNADLHWRRASVSAGLREEVIGGYGVVSSPGVSAAFMPTEKMKLRASVGYGFRLPTYTDRYYSDPTTQPNVNLKPESAWTYDGGIDWYVSSRFALSATGFSSQQHNAIDYTRPVGSSGAYQANNLTGFTFTGAELSMRAYFPRAGSLRIAYTSLTGVKDALSGLQSRYLFNYPSHNSSAEWIATVKQVAIRTRLGVAQRYTRDPYATLDVSAAREVGVIRPYVQMTNLSNTGYEEISGIRMQGRAFVGGLEIVLKR